MGDNIGGMTRIELQRFIENVVQTPGVVPKPPITPRSKIANGTVYRPLAWWGATLPAASAIVRPFFFDAEAATHLFFGILPDYVQGGVTVKVYRRCQVAVVGTKTAIMTKTSIRFREASALTIESAVPMNYVITNDATGHMTSWTIPGDNFQAGDSLRIDLARSGADVGDDLTTNVVIDGAWIEYMGSL